VRLRFFPGTEDENARDGSYRKPLPGQNYEQWMLHETTMVVLQLSDLTLQNHKVYLLDPKITSHPEFKLILKKPREKMLLILHAPKCCALQTVTGGALLLEEDMTCSRGHQVSTFKIVLLLYNF